MNLKDRIKSYKSEIILMFIILVFLIFKISGIFEKFKNNFEYKITIADVIAILTIFTLAAGVLFYTGVLIKAKEKYYLKKNNLDLKYRLSVLGALFVSLAVLVYLPNLYSLLLLFLFGLIISFGYHSEDARVKNVTLKMVTLDESGCKRLETRENLELFDTTDTDYYFKDSNRNEYIIPIVQVQEIIYEMHSNR